MAFLHLGANRCRAIATALVSAFAMIVLRPGVISVQGTPLQSPALMLHVDVNLQSVGVLVTNLQGGDVFGLSENDFQILEDGKPQGISFFDAGNESANVAILHSGWN